MKKIDIIFLIIILISLLLYTSVRNYSELFFLEPDSWIHVAKIKKYLFDSSPFQSPIFFEDKNHYTPLSYFFVNFYSKISGLNLIQSYGFLSAGLKVFYSLLLFVLPVRFFSINKNSTIYVILLLYILILPSYSFEFNPNVISTFFIFVIIFLFSLKTPNKFLLFLMYNCVLITHIFFFAFVFLYGILILTLKRLKFDLIFNNLVHQRINPQLILLMLIFFVSSFYGVNYFLMSEVGISINHYVALFGIGFLPIIFRKINNINYRQSCMVFGLIYLLMYIFYISKFWLFHSQYFSTFFVLCFIVPGTLIVLYENFNKAHLFYKLLFIVLVLILPLKESTFLVQQKAMSNQKWRESLLSELRPIVDSLRNKVLFIDPGNFLNRYIVIDFDAYLYAVNMNGDHGIKSVPFTTLPSNKLDKFAQFFHAVDRMNLADRFLSSPDESSYTSLFRYRIDYFILPNFPIQKYDIIKVKYFIENHLKIPPFLVTNKYTVYSNPPHMVVEGN